MKITKLVFNAVLATILLASCNSQQESKLASIPEYKPDDQELHKNIVAMDKAYFDAYNSCDLATQTKMYSDDIEFYHDQGGVMTVKQDIIDALEKNICKWCIINSTTIKSPMPHLNRASSLYYGNMLIMYGKLPKSLACINKIRAKKNLR